MELLLLLLTAHFIGDFYLRPASYSTSPPYKVISALATSCRT